jgi:hypothetical protein
MTVNMRNSAFPETSQRFDPQSAVSLSLFTLHKTTGHIRKIGEYRFSGRTPENAAFDATGEYVVVAVYQDVHGPRSKGRLDIWRVAREPRLSLENTRYAIELPRGAHHLLVVHHFGERVTVADFIRRIATDVGHTGLVDEDTEAEATSPPGITP